MRGLRPGFSLTALAILFMLATAVAMAREKKKPPAPAIVEVHTGREGCSVDLDSGAPEKTGESGVLIFASVEPGDHYLHIGCPDGKNTSRLILLAPGETLKVAADDDLSGAESGLPIAEIQLRLREYIRNAARLRARGHINEAAEQLRGARLLDPANSDLHRELGITFLVGKDWKRARVEMLEAIRSDPSDAEAYHGLGYALEKLGQIDAAVEAFHTASKLDPSETSYRRQYFNAIGRQTEQRAAQQNK